MIEGIGIELTTRCDRSCRHCMQERDQGPRDLPREVLRHLLQQLKGYGRPHLGITGGEPTMHPEFMGVIEDIVAAGCSYHLVTNGRRFGELFNHLVRCSGEQLARFCFSLESADEASHDAVRGAGSFRQVLGAVSVCAARNVPFTVQTVVTTRSLPELEAVASLCAKLGAARLFFAHPLHSPQPAKEGLLTSPAQRLEAEREIARLGDMFRLDIQLAVGHFCPYPFYQCSFLSMRQLFVNADGELCICCQLSRCAGAEAPGSEAVASLEESSLAQAHRKLASTIARVTKDKLQAYEEGTLNKVDLFPCFYCQKYFGKVGWLQRYPDSPWHEAEPLRPAATVGGPGPTLIATAGPAAGGHPQRVAPGERGRSPDDSVAE